MKKLKAILIALLALGLIGFIAIRFFGTSLEGDSSKLFYNEETGEYQYEEVKTEDTETTYKHIEKNYDIAVVFDNSGSMYLDNSQAWCRAKYALEVFASMLNYNERDGVPGDKLSIFPMADVVTDGSKPDANSSNGSKEPIEIKSVSDIKKIHNLYTIKALGTPYSSVEKAYESLSKSTAPEKWMIVLTDGEFDNVSVDTLGKNLAAMANEDIKIQYLGIGEAANLDAYATDYFYTKKSESSTSLRADIVDICNRIFQRNQLPDSYLNGNKLDLAISMKNIIVFCQGKNASIKGLKDSNGNEINIVSDSGPIKYSDLGAANYPNALVDDSLSGQVVTFDSCPKGTYTLDYSNSDSIQVFYVPDIDIALEFADAEGNKIDITGKRENLYPGEYIITYYLIDAKTGEDVTNSPLLAPVEFVGGYEDADGKQTIIKNGEKALFQPNSSLFLNVTATYLNNYELSTGNRRNDYTISISFPKIDVDLNTKQDNNYFVKSDIKDWEPIEIDLSLDGEKLSPLILENTKINVTEDNDKDIKYRIEKDPEESKAYVYLGQNEDGTYDDNIKSGDYNLNVSASYDDGSNQLESGKTDDIDFSIQSFPYYFRYLALLLLLLAIIALILWIRKKKRWPKNGEWGNSCIKSSTGEYDGLTNDLDSHENIDSSGYGIDEEDTKKFEEKEIKTKRPNAVFREGLVLNSNCAGTNEFITCTPQKSKKCNLAHKREERAINAQYFQWDSNYVEKVKIDSIEIKQKNADIVELKASGSILEWTNRENGKRCKVKIGDKSLINNEE